MICGGTREDIERLRHDTAYMNALGTDLIPDPTTAGDFCRRFAATDVVELMDRINAVRPQLWTGRGRDLLGPIAYIDADGTIAPTSGHHKAGMDISYKGIWVGDWDPTFAVSASEEDLDALRRLGLLLRDLYYDQARLSELIRSDPDAFEPEW